MLALLPLLAGCPPKASQRQMYLGPTEPMRDVVQEINKNTDRLPSMWSRGYFEANVVDRGKSHFVNGDLLMLYRRPDDLRIVGKKDIAGTVFEIGSNPERYWLRVGGDVDTMWWGTHANAGNVDPKQIPIPPALMLEVLGISSIDTNFRQPPAPVMRFNNDADAYMLLWTLPLADRWAAQKDVWFDRQTKLPMKVLLYDANGRVVLLADLSNHKPVEVAGVPKDQWPKVAANYRLYFPDSDTSVAFELDRPMLKNGPGPNTVPNDRSFAFPEEGGGANHVIPVDEPAAAPANAAPR
ncbi:MAG: hypothetical protein H7Z14_14440 [Anaerolineae bacterium]|nr:hypothetical protein [Phycisphaerae bacterium]